MYHFTYQLKWKLRKRPGIIVWACNANIWVLETRGQKFKVIHSYIKNPTTTNMRGEQEEETVTKLSLVDLGHF